MDGGRLLLAPRNLPEKLRTDLDAAEDESEEIDFAIEDSASLVPVVLTDLSLGFSQARWGAERLLFRDLSDGGSSVGLGLGRAG